MFTDLAKNYTESFCAFHPYPNITNREEYESLPTHMKDDLIQLGESYLHYQYPSMTATSFMEFCRTGNRVNHEALYMEKRRALNALVLAECVENKGRFLDDIMNGIFTICEESAWQLPAHNSYIRNTPNLPLPDHDNPVLDLFACETGAQLAMVYYLLKDSLDKISPIICNRIESELHKRIFTPYLTKHFWWMGQGDEIMCNWTIWCTQNVLIAAFSTMLLPQESLRELFIKASQSVDFFLKDYGMDGCCDEGAQYFRHAGLCLFNTLEVLNKVTKDHFKQCYQDTKIRNIAHYILNVHIYDKYYVNFADCSPVAGRAGVREFLFGKRLNSTDLMLFAAEDHRKNNDILLKEELNLFYRLQATFTQEEIENFNCDRSLQHPDVYYKSVGLFIARDSSFSLAVKAGHNADSHNHNDTGSFIVYKNGKPMIIDVGVESYTKKTFSQKRYEIWTMQSAYHNLPTFGEVMQKDGKNYKATNVETFLGPEKCNISMNIEDCYPKEANISSYRRNFILEKEDKITIEDTYGIIPKGSYLSLMTYEEPVIRENTIIVGTLGSIAVTGSTHFTIERIPITDQRLKTAWEHDIYRIKVYLEAASIKLELQANT